MTASLRAFFENIPQHYGKLVRWCERGLGEKESLNVLIVVLTNMLAEQKTALETLSAPKAVEPGATP